jgi:hypothetical protein
MGTLWQQLERTELGKECSSSAFQKTPGEDSPAFYLCRPVRHQRAGEGIDLMLSNLWKDAFVPLADQFGADAGHLKPRTQLGRRAEEHFNKISV